MAGLTSASIPTSTSDLLLDAFAAPPAPTPGFRLADVTAPSGIKFRHNSGAYGGNPPPQTPAARWAFFDHPFPARQSPLPFQRPYLPLQQHPHVLIPNH